MLGWALTFLIIALIAAVLGFGGIAGFAVEIAKIIFFVALILFVISAVVGLIRGRSPAARCTGSTRVSRRARTLARGLAGRELLPCRELMPEPNGVRGGSAASARRQNCARRMIRAEVVGAVDREQIRQPGARAIDAALDRSHRAVADGGRLFI